MKYDEEWLKEVLSDPGIYKIMQLGYEMNEVPFFVYKKMDFNRKEFENRVHELRELGWIEVEKDSYRITGLGKKVFEDFKHLE